jgi:hypothetical protein
MQFFVKGKLKGTYILSLKIEINYKISCWYYTELDIICHTN